MRTHWWVLVVACMTITGCGGSSSKSISFSGGVRKMEQQTLPASRTPGKKRRTWKRSRIVPNTSRLRVGDDQDLPLKAMQASVQIDGFRARVVLDCFFYNDKNEMLEGNFQLRLPNGASLDLFAFGESKFELQQDRVPAKAFFTSTNADIPPADTQKLLDQRADRWSNPKVAKVVPKARAAFAYNETVRRRVDPALVEWAGADVFAARVFPLQPKSLHHIVIGYDVSLVAVDDVYEYQLDLPKVPNCVVEMAIRQTGLPKTVVDPTTQPIVDGETHLYRYVNPTKRVITAQVSNAGNIALESQDADSQYFVTRFRPQLPSIQQVQKDNKAIFLVDVSLSSQPDRFNVWLKLLRTILEKNRDSIKEFAVLFFNIESFWWKQSYFTNTAANTDELLAFADTLCLEGATNLNRALGEAMRPKWHSDSSPISVGQLFLLSDGAATWGEDNLYALSKRLSDSRQTPLYAYTTGLSGTDNRALNHLTRESGGALFAVLNEDQVGSAAVAHRQKSWQIKQISSKECTDLMLAGRPSFLFPGQELMLVGRGLAPKAVDIVLSDGTKEKQVTIKIDHRLESNLARRAYGQVAVGQLESIPVIKEKLAIAYARHFQVPGRTCSLLMLETEADYKRFGIAAKEDGFVVKKQPASQLVTSALKQLASQLVDSKQMLLDWLRKLGSTPGVNWSMSTSLEVAIDQLPNSSFQVQLDSFACRRRHRKDVPPAVNKHLSAKVLPYTEVHHESSRRLRRVGKTDALRLLSSLVENRPGDSVISRDVGLTALSWGLGGEAYSLFRKVAKARPYEPHNYHAMARCLVDMKRIDLAIIWYEVALGGKWDDRFGNVRDIVMVDYIGLLRKVTSGKLKSAMSDFAEARRKTLEPKLPLQTADVLVTIMWNTDGTDVDLHVRDSAGELCYYSHPTTRMGGQLTRDVREGFGPEMFWLKSARRGKFSIKVDYFRSDIFRTSTRTKVYATVYRNWGTSSETVTRKVVILGKDKEKHDILKFRVE